MATPCSAIFAPVTPSATLFSPHTCNHHVKAFPQTRNPSTFLITHTVAIYLSPQIGIHACSDQKAPSRNTGWALRSFVRCIYRYLPALLGPSVHCWVPPKILHRCSCLPSPSGYHHPLITRVHHVQLHHAWPVFIELLGIHSVALLK